ncbi:MAG: hypothetical protein ITG02_03725 [Patulibacter sp.]|nr:hypothetical protein [Patulibacter sp.]
MASEAANREKTTTATVLRATERQIRLRLGKADGDREVTKRVTVPAELRDQLEGAKVPVVITGAGEKAKVELADDWASAVKAPAKKATPAKKPAAKKAPAKPAAAKPAAKKAPAKPAAKKPAAAKAAAKPAAKKPAAQKAPAKAAEPTEAPAAASSAPEDKPKSSRSRSRGKAKAPAAAVAAVATVATVAPAEIVKRIAAAVELVRGARRGPRLP